MKNGIIKKIVGLSLGIAMAIGVGVAVGHKSAVKAAEASTVVTFTPGTDTGATSVTKGDITATMTTMNNSSYYQIYAGQSGTFSTESGNITKIEFTCTASGTSKYGPGNASADVGTYDYSDNTGTWTGSAPSVTISSTAQVRMQTLEITYEPAVVGKSIKITGITSSGLYLKGESYDIGYEAVGFDSDPTITNVVWTVPSGAGSIADGKWTTASSAMENVKIQLDLKADGTDYHAEVTTNIDEVTFFKKNSPKNSFTTAQPFTVGHSFDVEYAYASAGTVNEDDEGITYRLENSGGTKIKDVIYNSTKFTTDDSGKYIDATYKGVNLKERYSITVTEAVDYSNGAFYQITSEPDSWVGSYLIAFGGKVFNGLSAANTYASATIHSATKRIEYSSSFAVVKIETMTGGYSIKIDDSANNLNKYISGTSGKNEMNFDNSQSLNTISWDSGESAVSIISNTSVLCWNNVSGVNGNLFRYYKPTTAAGDDYYYVDLYKWVSNSDKVNEFVTDYMHPEIPHNPLDSDTGACKGESGYYAEALAAFKNLTGAQRVLFVTNDTYANNWSRLQAWATANLRTLTVNTTTGEVTEGPVSGSNALTLKTDATNATVIVVVIISAVGVLFLGALLLLKKKKEN